MSIWGTAEGRNILRGKDDQYLQETLDCIRYPSTSERVLSQDQQEAVEAIEEELARRESHYQRWELFWKQFGL